MGTPNSRTIEQATAKTMSPVQRVMFMVCLIVAGEAVFGLPFHVARFFRPTVLQVFGFNNISW